MRNSHRRSLGALAWVGLAGSLAGGLPALGEEFSPHTGPRHPVRVYWAIRTSIPACRPTRSVSAYALARTQALRFAAGEEVSSSAGLKARLDRPLDFVLLADHAESLGMMERVLGGDAGVMGDEQARSWNAQLNSGPEGLAEFRKLFFARETRDAVPCSSSGATVCPRTSWSRSCSGMPARQ